MFTKRLRATARVCQSFVTLAADEFHFGDVNLGSKYAASVRLFNHSQLPAQMEVALVSQSVRVRRMALQVPANAFYDLKVDFVPRTVNPQYHKDLSISNVHNPANLLSLRLSAHIIDEHKVLFHSQFYQLTSPTFPELDQRPALPNAQTQLQSKVGSEAELSQLSSTPHAVRRSVSLGGQLAGRLVKSRPSLVSSSPSIVSDALSSAVAPTSDFPSAVHLLHFGRMVENNPWVRVVNVTNLSASPIELHWTASEPSELRLMQEALDSTMKHVPSASVSAASSSSSLSTGLHAVDEDGDDSSEASPNAESSAKPMCGAASPVSFLRAVPTRASQLLPGTSVHDLWMRFLDFCQSDISHSGPDEAPAGSPSSASSSTSFPSLSTLLASTSAPDPELLRRHCKREINRRRDLQRVVEAELLVPLSTLHLAPYQTVRVYVVWTIGAVQRPWLSTKLRSLDAEIRISLIRYPQLPGSSAEPLPPRCLPVQSLVCRSVLDVSQKHIHFGTLTSMEKHEKQLVLHNQSEVPLLFALRKTGSIASSDLIFPSHSMGVVRPYGHLELPFIFKPSLAGAFNEPVTIDNLQDPTNQAVVSVKANLRKPMNYWLKDIQLDFGVTSCHPLPRRNSGQPFQSNDSVKADGGEEEEAEEEEEGEGGDNGGSGSPSRASPLSQCIVLKNISAKPRVFKCQLRSLRLHSSRSKADIVELLLAQEQQLQLHHISRQRSVESFKTSASSSSLVSPEELSPSPPFSGASSPRVSVQGDGHENGAFGPTPVGVSTSTPSLPSLTRQPQPTAYSVHTHPHHPHSSSMNFPFPPSTSASSLASSSVPASPASANGSSPQRSSSRTPPPNSSMESTPFTPSMHPGHLSTSSLSQFASSPLPSSASSPTVALVPCSPSSVAPSAPPLRRLPILPTVTFHLEEVSGGGGGGELSGVEREEEEEHVQRKLRIAIRKGKIDKIEKLKKRLSELHSLTQRDRGTESGRQAGKDNGGAVALTPSSSPSHGLGAGHGVSVSTQTGSASAPVDDRRLHLQMAAAAEDGVQFTLEPNAVQTIKTTFYTKSEPRNTLPTLRVAAVVLFLILYPILSLCSPCYPAPTGRAHLQMAAPTSASRMKGQSVDSTFYRSLPCFLHHPAAHR